jgi:NAD-dependent SIR2 family protein deacetylase
MSVENVHQWLRDADAVLVGAGSGLSAEAGFDFGDPTSFAQNYPAMLQYGFRCKAELIGCGRLPQELEWGYYLAHVREVRFCDPPQAVYQRLREVVGDRDHFVLTTNADGLFEKNGFDPLRIATPQGDYARWQCLGPCSTETWPTRDLLDRYLPKIDPLTQRLPRGDHPRCPRCGGPAFLNVRGGDWFVEAPYVDGWSRYRDWLARVRDRRLVVFEIGAGFNTPMWIRWPAERLVRANPAARLVRINLRDPEVPCDIADRSASFASGAAAVLGSLVTPALAASGPPA